MAERVEQTRSAVRGLENLAPTDERPFVRDLVGRVQELLARAEEYSVEASRLDELLASEVSSTSSVRLERFEKLDATITSSLRVLRGTVEARIQERMRRAEEHSRTTEVAMFVLPLIAFLAGLLATGFAVRGLRNVAALFAGVERMRAGDFTTPIATSGDDEIAALARAFEGMAQGVETRERELHKKQTELLAAESFAAVGRVSAQVAHEVRNPLSSIGLNAELLEEHLAAATFPTPEQGKEARELLASVAREIDRATEITEEYLHLARIPSPTLRTTDLVQVLTDVLALTQPEFTHAGLVLRSTFPPTPLNIEIDEGQLRQVFQNLMRNAREAMLPGGTLTIAAWASSSRIEIRFQDTGVGIAADAGERIFEPFFTTKRSGTGIGLSISRQIIEAHGGTLTYQSAPGQGTTFAISLPRFEAPSRKSAA